MSTDWIKLCTTLQYNTSNIQWLDKSLSKRTCQKSQTVKGEFLQIGSQERLTPSGYLQQVPAN